MTKVFVEQPLALPGSANNVALIKTPYLYSKLIQGTRSKQFLQEPGVLWTFGGRGGRLNRRGLRYQVSGGRHDRRGLRHPGLNICSHSDLLPQATVRGAAGSAERIQPVSLGRIWVGNILNIQVKEIS